MGEYNRFFILQLGNIDKVNKLAFITILAKHLGLKLRSHTADYWGVINV